MCKHFILLLPNKPRQFHEVTTLLSQNDVNILGYGLSSEGRAGYLYLLCSPHDKAYCLLSEKYKFYFSEVTVQIAEVEHKPGTLASILKILATADPPINLPNSYQAISSSGKVLIVKEFNNLDESSRANRVLRDNGINILSSHPD